MATFNEISFDIIEILQNSQISDDVDISQEHVLYHINTQRALFLSQELNKPNRSLNPQLVQDLGCLKLVEVDAAECCSITTDCIALRTEKEMPKFLDMHDGAAVKKVGYVNKMSGHNWYTTHNKAVLASTGKYTSKTIQAFLLNNYMYVIINDPAQQGLEYINIRGVIEDPLAIGDFLCSDGTSCLSYDDQYPVSAKMIPPIRDAVLEKFGISKQMVKDNDNNAKDNLSQS